MKLSFYINFILDLEKVPILNEEESLAIDGFDTSILILDDIKDESKIRDGKPCYYLVYGIDKAIEEAKNLKEKSYKTLDKICLQRKINFIKRFRAKKLLDFLYQNIQQGESIDDLLQSTKIVHEKDLDKYDLMIRLFTGGHIKYGFLIGYLISTKNPSYKNIVVTIGEEIGLLRQIQDDVYDYDEKHHEPFGDIINHKNRLPELIFSLTSSEDEKKKLHQILENKKDLPTIKTIVFNDRIKREIESRVQKIKISIENKITSLPDEYQINLRKLINKFSF